MARNDDLRRVERAITRIGRISQSREALRLRSDRSGVQISRPGISILSALRASGPIRLSSVAKLTDLEAPLISREIKLLVDDGLVVRCGDPTDGRATIVELTKQGHSSYERYRKAIDDIMVETFSKWSAGDLATLGTYLERVAADFARRPRVGQ